MTLIHRRLKDVYTIQLPTTLPPTHRGKAFRFTYDLIVSFSVALPGKGKRQKTKEISVPIRIWANVSGKTFQLRFDKTDIAQYRIPFGPTMFSSPSSREPSRAKSWSKRVIRPLRRNGDRVLWIEVARKAGIPRARSKRTRSICLRR